MDENNHKKNTQQSKLADSFVIGQPSSQKTSATQDYTLPKTKRYTLQQELGRGGMGVVYKAYDNILRQTVAVKIIQQCDARQIQRFLNECKAMAQLDHPNIIKFFEFGVEPKPYFTMEYIGGKTLKDVIRDKKLNYVSLMNLMIQICEALSYAHKHNIIHRDIKPENIMITADSKVKIMDFGLAKMFDVDDESLSKTGDIVGSIHYMPPEQIRGEVCGQSDIYAVGAVLYECLTYEKVFRGDSQVDIMYQIFEKTPTPPHKLNAKISPYLEAICLKCIEKNVSKRYKDFRELLREFRNLKNNKPILAKKYSFQLQATNFLKKHYHVLVGIIFCTMLLTIVWLLQADKNQREQKPRSRTINDTTKNHREQKPRSRTINDTTPNRQKAEKHLAKGEQYRNQNMFKEAIVEYSQAIRLAGKGWHLYWKAYRSRGGAYSQENQHEEAFADYQKSLEYDPDNCYTVFARGILFQKVGDDEQALKDFSKAIELAESTLQRPEIMRDKGKTKIFIKGLLKILMSRAKIYMELKKFDLALVDFERYSKFAPKKPNVYYLQGMARKNLKHFGHAIRNFQKAISLGYRGKEKLNKEILSCKESLEKFINLATQAIEKSEKPQAQLYITRAKCYRQVQKFKKAIDDFNRAIALSPFTKKGRLYLDRADVYLSLREDKQALLDYKLIRKSYMKQLRAEQKEMVQLRIRNLEKRVQYNQK
ncbi:protein kinase domain-containing protein [Candidatus Uabimicrobium amorphum]|uniref:protein kinase domain-containing protein n=1 Tax=Uabimicrobium amorphum TaxID=2596890 RepID=UPI0034A39F61